MSLAEDVLSLVKSPQFREVDDYMRLASCDNDDLSVNSVEYNDRSWTYVRDRGYVISSYSDGLSYTDVEVTYSLEGEMLMVRRYIDDLVGGVIVIFSPSTTTVPEVKWSCEYREGKRNGLTINYVDGRPVRYRNYLDDELHGEDITMIYNDDYSNYEEVVSNYLFGEKY